MPKTGTTATQIIGLQRQAEMELAQGWTVGEICRGRGVSEASLYRWRPGSDPGSPCRTGRYLSARPDSVAVTGAPRSVHG
ncbi:transposase [Neoroseomonas alba]|uniref:transposase n=1 Tax=Roseomonas alba TaxID=2846776 RepID=UPI0034E27CBF